MIKIVSTSLAVAATFGLVACSKPAPQVETSDTLSDTSTSLVASELGLSIEFEKYQLANGLEVVLHVDKSDPIVAINLAAHVGSSREIQGRTGFAHLFEHLLFLDSENLGYGGLDEMNTRIGGDGTNGFTTSDMTQYFQAVPADALEKIIWAEADKLGFFINTVTQPVIDNEKQVVKNEKRQRVDNQPYGHNFDVIGKAIYPSDHPYSWQIIGTLADLDAATLQDVKDFYSRWYVPNNITVTLTGDFDPSHAKNLIEKYFGEIPSGEAIEPRQKRRVVLNQTISLAHEDNFATVPQLTMAWPSVEEYHPDSYALNILAEYLSIGKRAPFNEVLIDETQLTSDVTIFNFSKELAGEFYLFISATAGGDLDALPSAIETAFQRFEAHGISEADLGRIKTGFEVAFYNQLQSSLGKAIQLSQYNIFTGDPGFFAKEIDAIKTVTPQDVIRVYETYIKDKHKVLTSFVPKGEIRLAISGSQIASVVDELIIQGAENEVEFDPTQRTFEPTTSSFDRTIEPAFGSAYTLTAPDIWRRKLGANITAFGIESNETPLIYFTLNIDAGRDRGDPDKPAVAALTADMLNKGTVNRSAAELEDAIKALGSDITISADQNSTNISGNTLARNFDATISLVEEMLLEPRWDTQEFALLKRRQLDQLDQAAADPNAIAARESAKLTYPENHILSYTTYGTQEKLTAVTLEDLKAFYRSNYSPVNASLRIVGDTTAIKVSQAFAGISTRWNTPAPATTTLLPARPVETSTIYFYDIPGAKQSILDIQRPSLTAMHPDYPLAQALNYLLGDIYTSQLNIELRINKGYTYGVGSRFVGNKTTGEFLIRSSVRSNVTKESMALIRDIVTNFGPAFSAADLDTLKGALLRGQALQNETLSAKLDMLGEIADFSYPDNYQAQNASRIQDMTLVDFKALANKYLLPDAMNWIVVGDAQTQAARLVELGFGEPVILDKAN